MRSASLAIAAVVLTGVIGAGTSAPSKAASNAQCSSRAT
jgi:hypothetical protein